jgi:hypothetical protein
MIRSALRLVGSLDGVITSLPACLPAARVPQSSSNLPPEGIVHIDDRMKQQSTKAWAVDAIPKPACVRGPEQDARRWW